MPLVEEGVNYPRYLSTKDISGLPEGWQAIESKYLTGAYVGQTYVRYKKPGVPGQQGSIKSAIKKQALVDGKSEEEAKAIVDAYMEEKEKKAAEEREKAGQLEGQKRDEALKLFRDKIGPLDGATASKMEGWRAESIYRETCNQTAVTYYSPEGRAFCTLTAIEVAFGAKLMRGEDLGTLVSDARARVVKDDKGRVVNEVRREVMHTRTEEESRLMRESRCRDPDGQGAAQKKQKPSIGEESYREETELKINAAHPDKGSILTLLTERGFKESTEVLHLSGIPDSHPQARALSGFFYQRPDFFEEKVFYQQVWKHSKLDNLVSGGIYIFWNGRHWKIGPLNKTAAPFALMADDCDRPGLSKATWKVYCEPGDEGNPATSP